MSKRVDQHVQLTRPNTVLLSATVTGGKAERGVFTGAIANQIIDASGFFSKSIDSLMRYDKQKRPKVATVEPFENSAKAVSPQTSEIAFVFSEPLNGYHTGVDFGPAKKALFPKILERKWSEDHQKWIVEVELLPNTHYQMLLSTNFRTEQNVPILPYLLDFKTAAE